MAHEESEQKYDNHANSIVILRTGTLPIVIIIAKLQKSVGIKLLPGSIILIMSPFILGSRTLLKSNHISFLNAGSSYIVAICMPNFECYIISDLCIMSSISFLK